MLLTPYVILSTRENIVCGGPQSLHRRPNKFSIFNSQFSIYEMKISDDTLRKIHDTSIVTVADKLGIKLYGMGDEGRRACCPYHEDQHPSLHFSTKRGCFKCFVCGAKGDAIKLVQDQENLTFTEACEWIIKECNIIVTDDAPSIKSVVNNKTSSISPLPSDIKTMVPLSPDLVSRSMSLNSEFCKSVVAAGYLSDSQLRHAAARYRLGCTKDGGVIFWQIDEQQRVHTGKIMYYQPDCHRDKQHNPTWVHSLMKSQLPQKYEFHPCLFGQHLLTSDLGHQPSAVCIVESEKSAVILSEKCPDFIWLSCGGLQMFKPELLAPLVNYKVIIFPDTDETGEAFKAWAQVALEAHRLYKFRYPLRVSHLLEDHATPNQKQRKIDLVDFLYENSA